MNLSNEELKEYSREHVYYEIEMLFMSAFPRGVGSDVGHQQFLINLVTEVFVLHLRNLIIFLYPPELKYRRDDDVYAYHFFQNEEAWIEICPTISDRLKKAKRRADKELAHLTAERKDSSNPEKPWDKNVLIKEILPTLREFASKADDSKISENIAFLLNQDWIKEKA